MRTGRSYSPRTLLSNLIRLTAMPVGVGVVLRCNAASSCDSRSSGIATHNRRSRDALRQNSYTRHGLPARSSRFSPAPSAHNRRCAAARARQVFDTLATLTVAGFALRSASRPLWSGPTLGKSLQASNPFLRFSAVISPATARMRSIPASCRLRNVLRSVRCASCFCASTEPPLGYRSPPREHRGGQAAEPAHLVTLTPGCSPRIKSQLLLCPKLPMLSFRH